MSATPPFVPLVDLQAQYRSLQDELAPAIGAVLERCDFVLGEAVGRFERAFAAFCEAPHAVGCASGTDALQLACRGLGIGPGDEVIVPAFTFVASALGVTQAGARPVLVDVDARTGLIDPERAREAITPRTRALLPVHLYGQCADMDALGALAREHGLAVIEDAAQAHGARWQGRRAGSMGDAGCFSFYPGKNLGAYGDGGAIVCRDAALAERLQLWRNWGSRRKYHHEELGLNSRLDTLQAAVLAVKLPRLEAWNRRRRELAGRYDAALVDCPGIEPTRTAPDSAHHLYVVRTAERDEALAALQAAGIGAALHYPFAVHELGAYRWLGRGPGSFPVAEDWARRCLSLPLYPEMPEEAIERAREVLAARSLVC